jgi:hypothetical protein
MKSSEETAYFHFQDLTKKRIMVYQAYWQMLYQTNLVQR